jgi:hypothetical protein
MPVEHRVDVPHGGGGGLPMSVSSCVLSLVVAATVFLPPGPGVSASGQDPACVRKCGEQLDAAINTCNATGRKDLVACKIPEQFVKCLVDQNFDPRRVADCVLGDEAQKCAMKAVEKANTCKESALASHKSCVAGCRKQVAN